MDDVSSNLHLIRRGGTYHYRRRVPEEIQGQLGRQEVRRSLKTSSKPEAVKLRALMDLEWDAVFADARKKAAATANKKIIVKKSVKAAGLNRQQVETMVIDYARSQLESFRLRSEADPFETNEQRREVVQEKDWEIDQLSSPDSRHGQELIARQFGKLFGGSSFSEMENAEVAEILRKMLVRTVRGELAIIDGKEPDPLPQPKSDGRSFASIAKLYLQHQKSAAEVNGHNAKRFEKIEYEADLLVGIVGANVNVRTIDFAICLEIQRILAELPTNLTKRSNLHSLSVRDAAKAAREANLPTLAYLTQRGYIERFRGIMGFAEKLGAITSNPARDLAPLKKDDKKDHERKKPFSLDQLAAFFASPFYQQWKDGAEPYVAKDRDWRFWLPLICLFCGMRPQEVCQMRASNVKTSAGGALYFDVTAEGDDQTLKTIESARKVPVHSQLMELGFETFLDGIRKAKGENARLFYSLTPDRHGYYSSYPLRRFNESFLKSAMTLSPDQSFYSFRHCFRQALRRAKAPSDVVSALGGWSAGANVSDDYGDKYDPDYLKDWISQISYPGLELPFSYQLKNS